jgi:hypothetical protein
MLTESTMIGRASGVKWANSKANSKVRLLFCNDS